MDIGTNDLDFYEEGIEFDEVQQDTDIDDSGLSDLNSEDYSDDSLKTNDDDFLTSLLKSRGIEDRSRIKFENEDGTQSEINWNDLSNNDRLNIINSSLADPNTDLDESEIQLINTIRSNNMSPSEYLQFVEQNGIQRYAQNQQQSLNSFTTDQYSDDELFVMDFIARMGDVTDDEAREALDNAKANPDLYAKLIGAIRKEYQNQENLINQQAIAEQEQYAQEQYNQFANSVVDLINNFTEFSGYDLNMEQDDMQQLYEFITGVDAAGNNHFAKALADPKVLVRTAYLALNGQQMINDITNYFQKEITNVRKESYEKGKADALKMNNSNFIFTNKKRSNLIDYDDLD